MLKCDENTKASRRRFIALVGAACLLAPARAGAEILTRGSFGGRDKYLKRIRDLSNALGQLPRSDEGKRAEMRAVASTLSAAVKDMLFNEAQARGGKVAPPASALAQAPAASPAGTPVPIRDVPDDWLLRKGGEIQAGVADLLALLEDQAEPISSPTIAGLIGSITSAVAAIDRPGS